ncbi:hypothetical protein [Streptomyces sp. NPDC058092]|uniref:hypothetical protein n=1 Tax=Streptomyces sp. NPDC058092 TaxID=3346336 RepID=UPI0036EDC5AD
MHGVGELSLLHPDRADLEAEKVQGEQGLREGAFGAIQSDKSVLQPVLLDVFLCVDEFCGGHGARRGGGDAEGFGSFLVVRVDVGEEHGDVECRAAEPVDEHGTVDDTVGARVLPPLLKPMRATDGIR